MPGAAPAPPASRPPLQYRVRALQLVTIGLALGVWETAARAGWIDPLFVPAPGAVGAALGTIGGTALAALGDTLGKTAVAYVLSVTLGVAAGLTVGSVRLLREGLYPFVIALYSLPKILVLPWIVLLLGYGTAPAGLYRGIPRLFPRAGPRLRPGRDRCPPASSLVPASPHAPRGSAPTRSGVSLLRFAALAGLFLAPTVVTLHSISSRSGGRRARRSRRGGGTAMIRGGAAGALLAQALLTAPALGAELAVSRDVEIYGADVTGQLAPPVAAMEAELARRGRRPQCPARLGPR